MFRRTYFAAAVIKTKDREVKFHVHGIVAIRSLFKPDFEKKNILKSVGEKLKSGIPGVEESDVAILTSFNRI